MLIGIHHLLAILLLPFLVVVIVPAWLLTTFAACDYRWGDSSPTVWLARAAGIGGIVAGFGLFSWCVGLFVRIGQGTVVPWDPTRNLVAVGPYRFVRNPWSRPPCERSKKRPAWRSNSAASHGMP